MFIREVKKQRSKSSKTFFQYNLVQAARVEEKVKQRVILYLGSDPLLKDKTNRKTVLEILKSKIFSQPGMFPEKAPKNLADLALSYYDKYLIKYGQQADTQVSVPPAPDKAEYHNIDIKGLEVSDVKSFGAEHLCKQVLDKLALKDCLTAVGMSKQQADKALIAIAARAIFTSSELKTSQILEINSELKNCFHYTDPITHKQLYNISDKLYSHKDKIDSFLYNHISGLFDIDDKLVIFDISNTYFETGKPNSTLAKYGRSKEKRNDCPLVVFTGVINAQGFIRHSRIYEGNKPDLQTLSDMIADLEKHSGSAAKKTIVMDAGIATEDNLSLLREKEYDYVCVSRKRLKDYPTMEKGKTIRLTDRGKNKVELKVFRPQGYPDTWMYVESDAKRNKEQSMNNKLTARFEEDLHAIKAALTKKGGTRKTEKVWERIGRIRERHSNVSGRYEITITQADGTATDMQWKQKSSVVRDDKQKGVYFLRTSYQNPTEDELWDVYNTIREVESTFRCLKSDLQVRPVFHQKDKRIEAHIYLTLLAYQLVNTIRYMLIQNNIHYDWKNILRIMSTHTIQTVELPTDKKHIHLRKPAKPISEVQQIYQATGCTQTQKAIKKYVVYH